MVGAGLRPHRGRALQGHEPRHRDARGRAHRRVRRPRRERGGRVGRPPERPRRERALAGRLQRRHRVGAERERRRFPAARGAVHEDVRRPAHGRGRGRARRGRGQRPAGVRRRAALAHARPDRDHPQRRARGQTVSIPTSRDRRTSFGTSWFALDLPAGPGRSAGLRRRSLLPRDGRSRTRTAEPRIAHDYAALVSCRPFRKMAPGQTLEFEVAFVCAPTSTASPRHRARHDHAARRVGQLPARHDRVAHRPVRRGRAASPDTRPATEAPAASTSRWTRTASRIAGCTSTARRGPHEAVPHGTCV